MRNFRIPITQYDDDNFITTEHAVVVLSDDKVLTIDKGFITDLASIPKRLRGIINSYGRHTDAAVMHDYFYRNIVEGYTRKDADKEFLYIMKVDKVKWWKRTVMYRFVRWFGWARYKGFTE